MFKIVPMLVTRSRALTGSPWAVRTFSRITPTRCTAPLHFGQAEARILEHLQFDLRELLPEAGEGSLQQLLQVQRRVVLSCCE